MPGPVESGSIVQVVILALALGTADQISLHRLRASGSETSRDDSGRGTALGLLVNFALSAALISAFRLDRPLFDPGSVVHHGSSGSPPLLGVLGIVLSAVVFVVLGLLTLRGTRTRSSRARIIASRGCADASAAAGCSRARSRGNS